jgi:zinc transport system substrate-binding protein
MLRRSGWWLLAWAALAACAGCGGAAVDAEHARIAASNSYLEAAVRDLLGDDTRVLPLAGPGMCPGHFDVRPSQMEALRHCRLLLRFDFQKTLDTKLAEMTRRGLRIVEIPVGGGMCMPATYRAVCGEVAAALVERGLIESAAAGRRLDEIQARLDGLDAWVRETVASGAVRGRPAITSGHQAAFCRFLGLDVRATFNGTDATSTREIDDALREGSTAALIVANVPEGRRLADALAARLGARVVVFDNFPHPDHHAGRFDDLVRENAKRLIEAARP